MAARGRLPASQGPALHRGVGRYAGKLDRSPGLGCPLPDRYCGRPALATETDKGILQAADDPNRDFLLQAEIGLPVGILEPLPRTPHVFEPQKSDAREYALGAILTMDPREITSTSRRPVRRGDRGGAHGEDEPRYLQGAFRR